jgi:hypothetical protein
LRLHRHTWTLVLLFRLFSDTAIAAVSAKSIVPQTDLSKFILFSIFFPCILTCLYYCIKENALPIHFATYNAFQSLMLNRSGKISTDPIPFRMNIFYQFFRQFFLTLLKRWLCGP